MPDSISPKPQTIPLYEQIKSLLTKQLVDGRWRSGERLPNEFQLGEEFGVSQGTVRKALDAMTREGLLVRQQGRGTYVAEHDQQQSLFKFFHLVSDSQQRVLPESQVLDVSSAKATAKEQQQLWFEPGCERVFCIRRLRFLGGAPVIAETIKVPAWLIRSTAEARALPNAAYWYYQRMRGVTILRASEKLRAVAASEHEAEMLGVAPATPLLEIDRFAIDLRQRVVEHRISRCRTDHYYYLAE